MGHYWRTQLAVAAFGSGLALGAAEVHAQRVAPSKAPATSTKMPVAGTGQQAVPTVSAASSLLVSTVAAGTYTNYYVDPTQAAPVSDDHKLPFQATTPDAVVVTGSGAVLTLVFDEPPNPGFPTEVAFFLVSVSQDGSDLKYRSIGMGLGLTAEFIATLTADGSAVAPVGDGTPVPDIKLVVSGTYILPPTPGAIRFADLFHGVPSYDYVRSEALNRTYVPTRTRYGLARGKAQPITESHTDFDHAMTTQNHFINLDFSEQGYDITAMNGDVSKPGNKQYIFKLSAPGAYSISDGQSYAIPDGFIFVSLAAETISHSMEEVASSDSEASNQTSWTVGVSGGNTATDGGSANFGMSTMSTLKSEQSSLLAISDVISVFSRIVLDKPNVALADEFSSDLRRFIKSSNVTAASAIIELYGTHYPNAITYGARGVNLRRVQVSDFASMASTGYNASATGTYNTASATGSYSKQQTDSEKTGNSYSQEDYHSIGTSGSTNFAMFNASKETQAPVVFDLRPLDQLISPLFFPTEDQNLLKNARSLMQTAIQERIAAAPSLDYTSHFPDMFQITIGGITCINAYNNVNNLENSSTIYGNLSLTLPQGLSQGGNTQVWNSSAPVSATCDGHASFTPPKAQIIAVPRGGDATVNWSAAFGLSEAFSDRHAWGQDSFDPRTLVGKPRQFQVTNPIDSSTAPFYLFTVSVDKIPMR